MSMIIVVSVLQRNSWEDEQNVQTTFTLCCRTNDPAVVECSDDRL